MFAIPSRSFTHPARSLANLFSSQIALHAGCPLSHPCAAAAPGTPGRNPAAILSLLLLVCICASGCGLGTLTSLSQAKTKKAESATNGAGLNVVPDLHADASKDLNAYANYSAQIRVYLDQENFDQIDAIADEVRSQKSRFAGGAWKLQKLYCGLREPANSRQASDAVWQVQIGRLKKWVERKPKSITARVGLAAAYVEYAWHGRGRGFAGTVSEEGWKLLATRMATGKEILDQAKKMTDKCPHWYEVMLTIGMGQSWEMDEYNKVFEEAIAFEPAYHYFYGDKAEYLLPRWHGEPGDWERFADEMSKRLGGKLGSIIYYQIAMDVVDCYKDREFVTETKVSWPRIKQGFADLEERDGASARAMNLLCRLAGQAEDKPFTQELLKRIGDNWDPETWGTKEYFEHYKAWAASGD